MLSTKIGAPSEIGRDWHIILVSAIGCGLGYAALVFYTFGLFIDPLGAEFGWSRGEVSSIFSIASLGVLAAGPILGWLVDRVGSRLVALVSIPLFSALLFTVTQINGTLLSFRLVFSLGALAGLGTTPVVYTRIINERFDRSRGLALGLTLVGIGAAAILLPLLVSKIIAGSGWRTALQTLALLALVPWILVLKMMPRRNVAAIGVIQGKSRDGLSSILKSALFWRLSIGFFTVSLSVGAIVVHFVPIMRDLGVPQTGAVGTASLLGFGVIAGRLIVGWLLDRIFAPFVIVGMLLSASVGTVFLAEGGAAFAPIAATLIGFVLGFAGIALLVGPSHLGGSERVNPLGAVVLILGSLAWAAGSIYSRHNPVPHSPLLGVAMQSLAGGVGLWIVAAATGELHQFHPAQVTLRSWLAVLYLHVIQHVREG